MSAVPFQSENIPEFLKMQRRWALSTSGQVNFYGKEFSVKAPLFPVEGRRCCRGVKPNDASTWRTYHEVEAAQEALGGYPGILLGPDSEGAGQDVVGFDFDLAKASGKYREWVEFEVLPRCPGYVERSPSGTG